MLGLLQGVPVSGPEWVGPGGPVAGGEPRAEGHEEGVVVQPPGLGRAEVPQRLSFRFRPRQVAVPGGPQTGLTPLGDAFEIHPFDRECRGIAQVGVGQQARFDEGLEGDHQWIDREGRKTLVGRGAARRGTQREDLPQRLSGGGEPVNKAISRRAKVPHSKGAGERSHVQQDARLTSWLLRGFHVTCSSPRARETLRSRSVRRRIRQPSRGHSSAGRLELSKLQARSPLGPGPTESAARQVLELATLSQHEPRQHGLQARHPRRRLATSCSDRSHSSTSPRSERTRERSDLGRPVAVSCHASGRHPHHPGPTSGEHRVSRGLQEPHPPSPGHPLRPCRPCHSCRQACRVRA